MKCYKHYDKDAVSQCVECSRALCLKCTSKHDEPLCNQCMIKLTKSNRVTLIREMIRNIIIMVFIFFRVFNYINHIEIEVGMSGKIVVSLFVSAIPWGWTVLNKITSKYFLFLPLIGWLIYFAIKLVLSVYIGIFVMPFKIFQILKGIKKSNKIITYAYE
ncbi:hypothetical protein EDC19_0477 [Natranaerovirga hydrolytica]|uniref:B box-type domain-containing protein n=1 Tax=Natranaerovirga hydrolytica TaxID=680378 RepID=A0A4R1MZL6_9FIRM|nr:hypothetical protein EDC19_0477 [Natranaerovirga hydrolytica]